MTENMVVRALNNRTHLEDRQVHGNDQSADEYAEYRHDQRLEQAAQAIDGVVDLLFVEIGDLGQHQVQRTRLLVDGYHLDNHVGEHACLPHGELQLFTPSDSFAHLEDGLTVYHV